MIQGITFSIIAGIMISLQAIFNARISEKIGLWHANSFVHGTGFILAFIVLLLLNRKINFTRINEINPLYLLGGIIGAIIVFSAMKGVSGLGASYSVTIIIVTQLLITFIINIFGIFGESVINFSPIKILGLVMMISGVILFQLR